MEGIDLFVKILEKEGGEVRRKLIALKKIFQKIHFDTFFRFAGL